MAALLAPDEGMRVYDPACGSGELLLETGEHLRRRGKDVSKLRLYGEEMDPSLAEMAQKELLQSGVKAFNIRHGNTLARPQFYDDSELFPSRRVLTRFDRVLANPRFSLSNWGRDAWRRDEFGRDEYGVPPRSYADWAYVAHMLTSLEPEGRMAILLPYGALHRSRAEADIRRSLVEKDKLEAVISLGWVTETTSQVAILVFRHAKPSDRQYQVLFMDVAPTDPPATPHVLDDDAILFIDSNFGSFAEIPGRCRVAARREIEQNNYDLSASRYLPKLSNSSMLASKTRHVRATNGHVGALASVKTDVAKKLDAARRRRDEEAQRLMKPWLDAVSWFEAPQSRAPVHAEILSLHEVLAEGGLCDGTSPSKGGDVEVTCAGQTCLSVDGRVDVRLATRKRFASAVVRRLALQPGDILMVRVNGSVQRCGVAALLEHAWEPITCAPGILRLRG